MWICVGKPENFLAEPQGPRKVSLVGSVGGGQGAAAERNSLLPQGRVRPSTFSGRWERAELRKLCLYGGLRVPVV